MTNFEKYKDDIERLGYKRVAFNKFNNKIVKCAGFACDDCAFYGNYDDCKLGAMKWAAEEYKEPEVDWSKIPIDTPVLVSDDGVNWRRRYFVRRSETGLFCVYSNGTTSWSADNCESRYKYAKLWEMK